MTVKPIKIGILGEIRAGKDTVAQLLSHELSKLNKNDTDYLAFSTGIHEVIKLTMPELYTQGKPRKALQHIGQSLRQIKPDVWIDFLFKSHEYFVAQFLEHNIIITDVRQPNEAKRLQEEGFTIIKVTASSEVRMSRANANGDNFTPDMFNHETEQMIKLCPYDYHIDNSYSLDSLKSNVRAILEEVANIDKK